MRVDDAVLRGQAKDDGLPQGKLTSEWTLLSGPTGGEATLGNSKALFTSLAVTEPGTYVFKLTVSDSELEHSDTVTVEAAAAPPLAELLAHYTLTKPKERQSPMPPARL